MCRSLSICGGGESTLEQALYLGNPSPIFAPSFGGFIPVMPLE
jgi:hypothetical protein